MEFVLQRTEIELETLNPPTKKFSSFLSYTPRRSHLDSASYRSLTRILSHCLDHSLVPPTPPLKRALYARNPTSSHGRGELHLEQEEGANINEGAPIERHKEGVRCADGGEHEGSLVAAAQLVGLDLDDFDEKIEACVNNEMLSRVMSDCERLIDAPSADFHSSGESYEGKRQVGYEETVNNDLDIAKAHICSAAEGVSKLGEVSEVAEGGVNTELLNNIMHNVGRLIDVSNRDLCCGIQPHDGNVQAGHDEIVVNDMEISKACIHGVEEGVSNLWEVSQVANEDVNSKLLSRVIPDCRRSIDVPNGHLHSNRESHKVNLQAGHDETVEKVPEIAKACVNNSEEGIFNLGKVSDLAKGDANSKLLSRVTPECGKLIDSPNGELHWSSDLHDGKGQSNNEVIVDNDLEIAKTCGHGAEERISHIREVTKFAEGDANCELLNRVILDCCKLIDVKISKACVRGAEEGISHLGEVSEVSNGDELEKVEPDVCEERVGSSIKLLDDRRKGAQNICDLVSSEPVKGTNDERPILFESQYENSTGVKEKKESTEQPTYVHATSLMECLEMKVLDEDQVSTLAHQIDEGEFEEGEIPDEIQDLEGLVDIKDKERVHGSSRFDFNEVASSTTFIHKKEVLELGNGYNPSTIEGSGAIVGYEANHSDSSDKDSADEETQRKQMVMNARAKKQRTHLTEERKAKKKIAKKRKRAQKNREQGVKKLKLHAIMKPKEVKICNFYLMGRCQQGDLCKYSHNTPLTKSAPCKYFACNSCLKGDDCPYDHDLSKYPCHKFVSTGSCIRGDGCKFSHKIPTTDASSQLTSIKIDSDSFSEQSKSTNQPISGHISPLNKGSFEGYSKGTPSLRHKPLKEVNQVPKGIRFLSFGAVQTDLTTKVKERLPVKKFGHNVAYNLQKKDDLFAHGHHHNAFSVVSSGLVGDASSNRFAIKDSGNITKGSSITPSGTVNHEVSEATKILEEFLFCG